MQRKKETRRHAQHAENSSKQFRFLDDKKKIKQPASQQLDRNKADDDAMQLSSGAATTLGFE